MKKTILLLFLVLLVICSPVMAETLNGTLGAPSTLVSIDETLTIFGSDDVGVLGTTHYLKFLDISNDYGMTAVVLHTGVNLGGYDGIHEGVSIPFVAQLNAPGGTNLFTGSIGYTRIFAGDPAVEVDGYVYIVTDNFNENTIGLSGPQLIYLNYTEADWYGTFLRLYTGGPAMTESGMVCFQPPAIYNLQYAGDYIVNKYTTFQNTYSTTKPAGIGITGSVTKLVDAVSYPSRTYVYDGTTNLLLASEPTINPDTFTFNVPATSIKIGVAYSLPAQINSSILFAAAIPTPTPTPTGPPTGYIRTIVYAKNGNTGGIITGATLNLKDVENGTWVNTTSTSSGTIIDVLNGHTLDIYGTYPGFFTASAEIGAIPGGNYFLPLYPPTVPAGTGKVNLLVAVYDSSNGMSLSGVSVHEYESGTFKSDTQTTGIAGTAAFRVTNNTAISITATKSGYATTTKGITTGDFVDSFTTISMIRQATATPTPYIPPTIGVIPTVSGGTGGTGLNTTGNYSGFWGPLANGLEGMGVLPSELGIVLATLLIFIGFCVGGWSGAAYSPGAPFNGSGSIAGGIFGFILACAFGFIPIVWVIGIVFIGIFIFIFFSRG